MLLFKSEITNAELKVASGEKVWGYEMQCDLENVHVYKKLLEDVGKRSGTLQSLILRLICMRSAWTIIYNLVRPKKELVKVIMMTCLAFSNHSSLLCVWLYRCYFCLLVVVCSFMGPCFVSR